MYSISPLKCSIVTHNTYGQSEKTWSGFFGASDTPPTASNVQLVVLKTDDAGSKVEDIMKAGDSIPVHSWVYCKYEYKDRDNDAESAYSNQHEPVVFEYVNNVDDGDYNYGMKTVKYVSPPTTMKVARYDVRGDMVYIYAGMAGNSLSCTVTPMQTIDSLVGDPAESITVPIGGPLVPLLNGETVFELDSSDISNMQPYSTTPECQFGCGVASDGVEFCEDTKEDWKNLDVATGSWAELVQVVPTAQLDHITQTAVVDWNEDGFMDIIVAYNNHGDSGSAKLSLYLNTQDPVDSYGPETVLDSGTAVVALAVGNVYRDAEPEVVVLFADRLEVISSALSVGTVVVRGPGGNADMITAIVVMDANMDLKKDILYNEYDTKLKYFTYDINVDIWASTEFLYETDRTITGQPQLVHLVTADFDDDGRMDVLVEQKSGDKSFRILFGDTTKAMVSLLSFGSSVDVTPCAGDINDDGIPDAIFARHDLYSGNEHIVFNYAEITTKTSAPWLNVNLLQGPSSEHCGRPTAVTVADFNNNLVNDVAAFCAASGGTTFTQIIMYVLIHKQKTQTLTQAQTLLHTFTHSYTLHTYTYMNLGMHAFILTFTLSFTYLFTFIFTFMFTFMFTFTFTLSFTASRERWVHYIRGPRIPCSRLAETSKG